MEEVNINDIVPVDDEPADVKVRKPRRTKLEMEAARELGISKKKEKTEKQKEKYIKSFEQKEAGKRQKNCQYWMVNYGVYIDPTNLEEYLWFKKNKLLVVRLLPILDRVNQLKIPYLERTKS